MTMPIGGSEGLDHVPSQFSLRDILTVVFKRRNLIILLVLSVMAATVVLSLLQPRIYRVSANLLVNRARVEVPIGPTESAQAFVGRVSEQDLNSEIEIIKSREMIEDVLQVLGVDEMLRPKSSGIDRVVATVRKFFGGHELSFFDSMVVHLQERIYIRPVRRSNVIRITYQSEDPEWATRVVRTLTERYLVKRAERSQSSQAVVFFEQQMRDAELRLADTEKALARYVDEASITIVAGDENSDALTVQKGSVMSRLASLEAELGDAEVALESRIREVANLREQISREPKRLESPNRQNQDATTEEIERALTTLRLERDALLQDFRPDSRHVRDIDTQIRLAEERLETAKKRTIFSGTESNPVYVQLKGDLLRNETEIEGIRARIISLRMHVAESRVELKDLNEKAFGVENLRRLAQAAEEDYLLYRKKSEEARISAAMDQEKFVNVTIVQPAQMPLRPEPRDLLRRFLMAVVVGLLGGFGIAIGVDKFLSHSFTTGEEVERKLGIPHIASIPDGIPAG